MIFGMSPTTWDNQAKESYSGPAGEFLWQQLSRVGIARSDCDTTYAVRCFPCRPQKGDRRNILVRRDPTREEIRRCSLHTDRVFSVAKPKLILVLGKAAMLTLLRRRSLPETRIFWSRALGARVFYADSPAIFAHGYRSGHSYAMFRAVLTQLGEEFRDPDTDRSDPYWYLRRQKYRLIKTESAAHKAIALLRRDSAAGSIVSVDIEDDTDDTGNPFIVAVGFSSRPGTAVVFRVQGNDALLRAVSGLLADPSFRVTLHHGCTDVDKLAAAGVRVAAYVHDTNLSEYMRFSDVHSYGLDALADRRFPGRFGGYKRIIADELIKYDPQLPADAGTWSARKRYKHVLKNGKTLFRVSRLSDDTLRLYNGADCDLGKRITDDNLPGTPPALMRLYIDLSFILHRMETNGPLFDRAHSEKLAYVYPAFTQQALARLRAVAGPTYNPGSGPQVHKLLYDTLGLTFPFPEEKVNTRKMTLTLLAREHEVPALQLRWRTVSRVTAIVRAYQTCAEMNGGVLRTLWWSTGTRTGRLSSGGGKQGRRPDVINLQNIKRDPQIQNMCVADANWEQTYNRIRDILAAHGPVVLLWWDQCDAEAELAKREKRKPLPVPYPAGYQEQWDACERQVTAYCESNEVYTYLIFDYGQVEVRVAAQMSGDDNLITDCTESDIHTRVGVAMTGWDADRIKNDEVTRTLTKNVHFGILFGITKENLFRFVLAMSPSDMRDRLSEDEVGAAYDKYFARYPGIARFIEARRQFARKHGYAETLFGMRQTLNIRDDSPRLGDDITDEGTIDDRESSWRNQAVNGPVQGTAHQLMICALVNLIRQAAKYAPLGLPRLEVHDALYFRVPVRLLQLTYRLGRYLLEQESLATVRSDFPHIEWRVPIVVDAKAGVRLGTRVKVTDTTTPGAYMLNWWRVCREQMTAMDRDIAAAAAILSH